MKRVIAILLAIVTIACTFSFSAGADEPQDELKMSEIDVPAGAMPGLPVQILSRGNKPSDEQEKPLLVFDDVPFEGKVKDINPADIKAFDILEDDETGATVVKIQTTFTGTLPLYILNGLPVGGDELAAIDRKEIETISLLKDENTAEFYGAKAANGIVFVFTDPALADLDDDDESIYADDWAKMYDGFTDMAQDAWYREDVEYCLGEGIMNGTSATTFTPAAPISRAMFVTTLWRIDGEKYPDYYMKFEDVKSGEWYTEAIRWAAAEKIVNGYSDEKFGVSDPITRQQIAAVLYRYALRLGIDTEEVTKDTNTLSYDDAFEVGEAYAAGVHFCIAAGIIEGSNGNIYPEKTATRVQAAAMLHRFCEFIETAPSTEDKEAAWVMNTEFGEAEMPENVKKTFDAATAGFLGVKYTPVAYLGSQVVAGVNHAFLCTGTRVAATPETKLYVIEVYAKLDGTADVKRIKELTSFAGADEEIDGSELVVGGYYYENASGSALPENVQQAFDGATEGLTGMKYEPLALLGSQLVAGMNYAVLCKATSVTASPVTSLKIAVVYSQLDGSATLSSASDFIF